MSEVLKFPNAFEKVAKGVTQIPQKAEATKTRVFMMTPAELQKSVMLLWETTEYNRAHIKLQQVCIEEIRQLIINARMHLFGGAKDSALIKLNMALQVIAAVDEGKDDNAAPSQP